MKKISKKILSIFLAISLIIGSIATSAIASDDSNSKNPSDGIVLKISTEKKNYKKGEDITFNVDVKNTTEENKTDIDVKIDCNWFNFDIEEGSSINIKQLNAGETKTIQFHAKYLRLNLFEFVRIMFQRLASWFARTLFGSNSETTRYSVRVDLIKRLFVFSVEVGGTAEEKSFLINYNLSGIKVEGYPTSQVVKEEEIPIEPDMPENDDYIFAGWYKTSEYSEPYNFEESLESDITIYAKWLEKSTDLKKILSENSIYEEINNNTVDFESATGCFDVSVKYKLRNGNGGVVISHSNDAILAKTAGIIGKPVDINLISDDELESAKIVFNYDESSLGADIDENKLGIIWYDESNRRLVLLKSDVDVNNNTVSVSTNHFSKYLLVDTDAWTKAWEHKQMVSRDAGKSLRYNICMCLDTSGSMSGSPVSTCEESAKAFIDQLLAGDSIAVVGFNSTATTLVSQTKITESNKEFIKSNINLKANGGTNFNNALNQAISLLNGMNDHSSEYEIYKKYIVLISDGQSSVSASVISDIVDAGYNVITIGIGSSVSASVLQNLSSSTSGSYAYVSSASEISSVFQQIQGKYIGLTQDTDGDKIADLVETTGMIVECGDIFKTNPNSVDTDGDGLSDTEEVGTYDEAKGYFIMNSDPTTPTFVSDDAKVSLNVALSNNSKVESMNPDDYKHQKINISISTATREYPSLTIDGKEYYDFLSENKYSNAKDVSITIKTTQGVNEKIEIGEITAGDTKKCTLMLSVEDIYKSNGTLTVSVSGSNFDAIECTKEYDFLSDFLNYLDKKVTSNEMNLRNKGTQAVRFVAQDQKEAEKKIDEIIYLNESTIGGGFNSASKAVKTELEKKLSQIYKEKAQQYADSKKKLNSKDGEKLIKQVASQFSSETTELTFSIGAIEYKAVISDTSYMMAGFGMIDVTGSNGVKYSFVYSSSVEQAESAMYSYMETCKELGNDVLKNCIKETLKDAGKILEINVIKGLVEAKCGDIIDRSLSKNNISFRYSDIKTCYNYYEKAKNAINSCRGKNPSAKDIKKAISSVEDLVCFNF